MNLSIWICTIEYYSTHQWPHDWKRSVFIPLLKMGNAKECSNYGTTVLISHVSKIMLKILQARLQQYVNRELPDVHTWFQRSRGIRDQIDNICGSRRKQGSSRKASASTSLTTLKPLTVWITTNSAKFLNSWEWQTTWPASWEIWGQEAIVRIEHGTTNWFQIGKGVHWTMVLEKTLESPLDCKEIQAVHPKANQSWVFIGRTDVEAETPIFWLPDAKSWLIWTDPDVRKDWRQ